MTITTRGALRLALHDVGSALDAGATDEDVRSKIDALLTQIERWGRSTMTEDSAEQTSNQKCS